MVETGAKLLMALVTALALAIIVSKRSNTANVLSAFMNGFAKLMTAAASPLK